MAIKKSDLYSSIWASCDELRGGMDASQYKDYVLFMLFIKYITDKYGNSQHFAPPVAIPKGASFKDMIVLKGKSDIGDKINTKIIQPLIDANARLARSDFPDFNDPNKLGEGDAMVQRLTNLISIFQKPELDFSQNRADHDDILGDAYEYLMRHFATESGKSKGQFYTPAEVSRVIARVIGISPANTKASTTAYDPTCGSGSLLLKVVRERAVMPLNADTPALPPHERRTWWEFCHELHEFFSNILRDQLVSKADGHHIARLDWILLRGTYVFGTADPALRGEQRRYVELCEIVGAAFPIIADDTECIKEACRILFGPKRVWQDGTPREPAEALALIENRINWWKDWENDPSPITWVKQRAYAIHERDHTHGGTIRESDALYRTPRRKLASREPSTGAGNESTARDVIPLEELKELSVAEVSTRPRYSRVSVAMLEAAIQDDEELRAYAQLRHTGWKRRDAWERLGWDARRGEAVDRRYRRFRADAKTTGFDYQTREIDLPPGLSAASCTVVKERLRFPVNPASEGTLSGRVVYEPWVSGERWESND